MSSVKGDIIVKWWGRGHLGIDMILPCHLYFTGRGKIDKASSVFPTLSYFMKQKSYILAFWGDVGVYFIVELGFFSNGISVILILMGGIVVSCSPTVCGFLSFWLTVFGKRRSFTVLWYRSFASSCLMQVNIWKTLLHLTVNNYTICDS